MLITCKECSLPVSDKAFACPHCGFPINSKISVSKPSKVKRLPNGFGRITKISNRNLRNPYRAMITVGFTENGKPISRLLKPVAYFKTYNDAYKALLEHHSKPYNNCMENISLKELFNKWLNDYFDPNKKTSQYIHSISMFKKLKEIESYNVKDLKAIMLKEYIENLNISADYKARLKYLLNQLYDYAVSLEIVEKNISRMFELSTNIRNTRKMDSVNHIPFTNDELIKLWEHKYNKDVQSILIACYSGWRPGELCNMKPENISLEDQTFTGGSKTKAGINRVVPIHSCIKDFVETKYQSGFGSYKSFRKKFNEVMNIMQMHHTPHDCRTTFITNCKKYNVDEYAIKYMVGHSITDLTERVYTKRTISWLRDEIEKIKVYD